MDLDDGQGLTRFGIAQESHPDLPPTFYTMSSSSALSVAKQIYKDIYWNRFQGDAITDDGVASCLLSFSINDGTAREVRMLQECLAIPVDGVFGPVTLEHCNSYNPIQLAAALRVAQADFYRALATSDSRNARFLNGWLRRAARIYPSLL